MTIIKMAGLQLDVAWEDRRANFEKVRGFAQTAVEEGVRVLVLPEMFSTGFSLNPSVTAEPPDGETPTFIRELARDFGLVVIGGYVQQRQNGKGANAALAVDSNGVMLAEYFKAHLFTFMDEEKSHDSGSGPRAFVLDGMEMTCFVCYDLRFPEMFRLVAEGASMVFVIASWPKDRQRHWDILLPARAVENQFYVMGVNRVGSGGGYSFTGGTTIIDPMGNTIAHGGKDEGLVIAKIDTDMAADTRARLPFLKDRRF
jgi:predicted amidohydrolase